MCKEILTPDWSGRMGGSIYTRSIYIRSSTAQSYTSQRVRGRAHYTTLPLSSKVPLRGLSSRTCTFPFNFDGSVFMEVELTVLYPMAAEKRRVKKNPLRKKNHPHLIVTARMMN